MRVSDILKIQQPLYHEIDRAITDSAIYIAAKAAAKGNTAQEPDFVASLCLRFAPHLYQILENFFPANKFAVTSVFCHQKPIVDIGETKNPELGDLLLIYVYTDWSGNKNYNSILLQAKITSKAVSKVSASDMHQLKLYEKWPDFTYLRAGKLTGTNRLIVPKAATNGGQYLLIDNDPSKGLSGTINQFPMGCATAAPTLTLTRNFAAEIVEFLKFRTGRQFEEDPTKTTDEWTKMVWDLLNITKNVQSKRVNADLKGFDRQNTRQPSNYIFFASGINSILSDLHSRPYYENDFVEQLKAESEDESGVSVIVIESNDGEGRRRDDKE